MRRASRCWTRCSIPRRSTCRVARPWRLTGADGVVTFIAKSDAYVLYDVGSKKYIHETMVRALKRDGYLPVALFNGFKGLAHINHPKMAVTVGGKRVITNVHEVTKLWDGQWDYTRNILTMNVCGHAFSYRKVDGVDSIALTQEMVSDAWNPWLDMHLQTEPEMRDRRLLQILKHGWNGTNTAFMRDGNVVASDYYNKPRTALESMAAAIEIAAHKHDDTWLQAKLSYQRKAILKWAEVAVMIGNAWDARKKAHEMQMAEANAVQAVGDDELLRLLEQADDAVQTAVVRRWPRLATTDHTIEQVVIHPHHLPVTWRLPGWRQQQP